MAKQTTEKLGQTQSKTTKYIIPTSEFLEEHLLPVMKRKDKMRWAEKLELLANILRESADYKEEV